MVSSQVKEPKSAPKMTLNTRAFMSASSYCKKSSKIGQNLEVIAQSDLRSTRALDASASITNPSTHLDDARLLVVSMILLFRNVLDRADDQQPILDLISQTKLFEH